MPADFAKQAPARVRIRGHGGEEETIDTRGGNGKLIFTILLAMQEAALDTLKAGWRASKARGRVPPSARARL